jgi:putative ABC transport system permease protein
VPGFYQASAVVVATPQLTTTEGSGEDLSVTNDALPEGGLVDDGLARRIAAVPGVRRVVADVTVPTQLVAASGAGAIVSVSGHPWSAAALTPFSLQAGTAPAASGEVVLGAAAARAAGWHPAGRCGWCWVR